MLIKELKSTHTELDSYSKISVAILCEELRYTEEDKHIVDTALALVNYGHRVVIFTNKNNLRRGHRKIRKRLEIVIIGKFIPKSIFGYFQNSLLSIWSIYAAFFTSIFKPQENTNIIFCDGNIYALPILNILGSYKIIQFHNLYSFDDVPIEKEKVKLPKSWIDLHIFANEVLLPNKASRTLFEQKYNKLPIQKTVLYPCICTSHSISPRSRHIYGIPIPKRFLLPNLPLNNVIFVVFGDYFPRFNFELAINALAILTKKVRKHNVTKIQLVIGGNYNKKNKDQYRYCSYLLHLIKKYNLSKNVTFLNTIQPVAKKSLIEHSVAVIQTTEANIYNRNILEAMCFSKPVIATNSAFSYEVLEHGITGYILPPEPIRFAEIMHEIIYNPNTSKMVGDAAYVEYQKKFSFPQFAKDVNRLVMKYNMKSRMDTLKWEFLRSSRFHRRQLVEEYLDTEIFVNESNVVEDFIVY